MIFHLGLITQSSIGLQITTFKHKKYIQIHSNHYNLIQQTYTKVDLANSSHWHLNIYQCTIKKQVSDYTHISLLRKWKLWNARITIINITYFYVTIFIRNGSKSYAGYIYKPNYAFCIEQSLNTSVSSYLWIDVKCLNSRAMVCNGYKKVLRCGHAGLRRWSRSCRLRCSSIDMLSECVSAACDAFWSQQGAGGGGGRGWRAA